MVLPPFLRTILTSALCAVMFLPVMVPQQARAADGQAAFKMAVVDLNVLMNESNAGKDLLLKIKKKREQYQKEINKIEVDLKKLEKEILSKKDITKEQAQKERERFQKKLMEGRKEIQKRQSALDKGFAASMKILKGKIVEVVGTLAEEKKITAVVRRETVIVTQKELDLTGEALAALNKAVKTIKLDVK